MKEVMLALHGWGSNGLDSTTLKVLRDNFADDPDIEIYTPTCNYTNPDDVAQQLLGICKSRQPTVIFGISVGGFWARWLANQYKYAKLIMINPALNICEAGIPLTVASDFTNACQLALQDYQIIQDVHHLHVTAIVAKDDDIVDPKAVFNCVGDWRYDLRYITGGHRVQYKEQWLPIVEYAMNSMSI